MSYNLSTGNLRNILEGEPSDDLWQEEHIFQLLSVRRVHGPPRGDTAVNRFRLIVSDGEVYSQAMLATQLNHLVPPHIVDPDNKNIVKNVAGDQIDKNVVVKVSKLTSNIIGGRKILIVHGLSVVGSCGKIGDPVSLDIDGAPGGAAAPSATTTPAAPNQPSIPAAQRAPVGPPVLPIEALSPYQNKWTIRARVTQKSDVRTWSNPRGEGKLFSANFMDDSGEIKGVAFGQQADEFHAKLEEGKVYFISKARVNLAKKKFSNLPNEYELALERGTEITLCPDQNNLPAMKYSFVPIDKLPDLQENQICDVIGVVSQVGEITQFTTRATNRQATKRELTIADQSGRSVQLTLWGKQAEQYDTNEEKPVVAFKGVTVKSYGGRSLSALSSSMLTMNPDITEAHALRGWYDAGGGQQKIEPFSNSTAGSSSAVLDRKEMRTLADVKESQLGMSDKQDYFSCRATIVHIKSETVSYPSCPSPGCKKKVVEGNDGWRCEKCDQVYTEPTHRYLVSLSVADHTGQAWLQCFDDAGEVIFGMPANELVGIKERNESDFTAVLHKANCNTYNFTCRAKQDTFNDQTRVRFSILRIARLDYKAEAATLRDQLDSAWAA